MFTKRILLIAPVLAILLTLPSVLGAMTTLPPFTINFSTNQLQFALTQGDIFNGQISATGAVRFWVSAPDGGQALNLGIVNQTQTKTFSLIPQQNGTYTLNFENDMPTDVQVTFSYSSTSISANGGASGKINIYYLALTVGLAVAGSGVVILLLRRKTMPPNSAEPAKVTAN